MATDAQKEYINKSLKKNGNVLVWIFAPGIIRNKSKSTFAEATYEPNRISEVTGFELKQIPDGPLRTTIQGSDELTHQITNKTFGDASVLGPRFAAQSDITYASESLFAVHSLSGGDRVFTVDNKYKTAKELFSDQIYTVKDGTFAAIVPPGGTVLFLLK